MTFFYNTGWEMKTLSDAEGKPLRFFLKAGSHTLRMEVTLGEMGSVLKDVEDSNINLDYLYVSYSREDATPVAVMHASGYAEVEACLKNRGYSLV